MPACSAIEPGTGLASTAFAMSTPVQLTTVYNTTASSRLISGPAATMAARAARGWLLKARWRSAGATGASRSSSILTYPPMGKAPSTNSVGEPLGCQRNRVWPNPTENRNTRTPQATATR